MTRHEIIKLNKDFLIFLCEHGIDPKDVHYLSMVEEFKKMKAQKHKVAYIVCYLSSKYSITERAVYKIVKRFSERYKA